MEDVEALEHVWLRFHNNTREAVELHMSGAMGRSYGDASLYFDIEKDGKSVMNHRCHVCSFNQIRPGGTLTFVVPMEWCDMGTDLRLTYRVKGKSAGGSTDIYRIERSVLFNFKNIPPKKQSRKKQV